MPKSTLMENEALDALNDMIAANLYCPPETLDKANNCITMDVGDKKYLDFSDFIKNNNWEGVAL